MKRKINNKLLGITINDDGVVSNPSLHDGLLKKIELEENKKVLLLIHTVDGSHYEIELCNVHRLRAMDFMEGNIVFEMIIEKGKLSDHNILMQLLQISDKKDKYFERILDKIAKNEVILVQLNPSYGCELTALCESIIISKK